MQVCEFIASVPTFAVEDGVIKDKTIRWHALIPLTAISVVIDTTQEDLSLPVADGVYITSRYLYYVSDHGVNVGRSQLEGSFDVTKESLAQTLKAFVISSAVGLAVAALMTSLISFFLLVFVSAILGWIIGVRAKDGRVWRSSAIMWFVSLILSLIAGYFTVGTIGSLGIFVVCLLINLVWLRSIQH